MGVKGDFDRSRQGVEVPQGPLGQRPQVRLRWPGTRTTRITATHGPKSPRQKQSLRVFGPTGGSQLIGGTPRQVGTRTAGSTKAVGSIGERSCAFSATLQLWSVCNPSTASPIKCTIQSMHFSLTSRISQHERGCDLVARRDPKRTTSVYDLV